MPVPIIRIYTLINKFFEWLSLSLLILMTLVTMYRVTMRYFFSFTPSWTEELSCILMIWLAMIGFAIGVRERMHLKITLFYDSFAKPVQKLLDILFLLLQGATGLYLVLAGLRLSIDQFATTMSAVKIFPFAKRLMPNSILYVIVPVTGILILIYTVIHLFDKNNSFQLRTLDTEVSKKLEGLEDSWE